jgi:hypothetical protein
MKKFWKKLVDTVIEKEDILDLDDSNHKEFLESFEPGEFLQLTVLVKTSEFKNFIDALKEAEVQAAVMPHLESLNDDDDDKGTLQ